MNTPVILAAGLCKSFNGRAVLNGIDLIVPAGQVVGLLGVNGAGKTTFIQCLVGLLRPDAGRGELLGCDSWNLGEEEKARIGYVPQESTAFSGLSVQGVIDYVATFYDHWDRARARTLCERWHLPPGDRVTTLSVGQRQQLAVVLALGHHPDLLLLDEPVASFDPLARRVFLEAILAEVADYGTTVLFSTHITSDVERIASHVAILGNGRIAVAEELDALKDRVKRLRILGNRRPLPADTRLPGAHRVVVEGEALVATITDASPERIAALAAAHDAEIRIDDLNLEEIFVELARPSRPGVATAP